MKTNRQNKNNTFSLKELGRKALTVLLTVSMVSMNTPLAYAAEGIVSVDQGEETSQDTGIIVTSPEENSPTESQPMIETVNQKDANSADEVVLALDFTHAYINYQGQVVGMQMTSITVPKNTDFRFTAAADEGCVLKEVRYVLAGQATVLTADAEGFYTIPANQVVAGISLQVTADGDPFQTKTSSDGISVARNQQSEFVYEDKDKSIRVTATLTDPSVLPANVEFKVTPITPTSEDYNYQAYLEALNDHADPSEQLTDKNILLYDFAFLTPKLDSKGNVIPNEYVEVQLDTGQVKLDIQFKKDQMSEKEGFEESSDVQIVHLPLIDSVRSSVDTTADAKTISAKDVLVEEPIEQNADVDAQEVQLSLDSLSVVAIRGNMRSNAGTDTNPSEEGAQTRGQTEDQTEGQTEPVVVPSINESTNLADFLTSATFNAPRNENGTYVVTPGTSYRFVLTFAERDNPGDTLQFPNSNVDMTYTLPAGLEVADGHEGTFTIGVEEDVDGVTNKFLITDNTYHIDNGVLTLNFNSVHEYFSKLAAAPDANFSLWFEGSITEHADKLLFADGIEKSIEIDNSNSVSVYKDSSVNLNAKKVTYTITVRSDGNSKNVRVQDTISSSVNDLITQLRGFSIKSSISSHDVSSLTPVMDNNHFEYVIPQMSDGEVIKIEYEAALDPTKLSCDENGSYIGIVNNAAEVWSDGDPTHHQVLIEKTIDYTPTVSKKKGELTATEGKKQTIKWTVDANESRIVSMAGTTITDTIHTSSQDNMTYSGDGIVVKVTKKNSAGKDEVVRTDSLSWDQLEAKTDSTWSYKVPETDAGEAYKYTITYYTKVDTTGMIAITTMTNVVETSGGKTSKNTVSVTPSDGVVNVSKEVTNIDVENKKIGWKVTFNVPAEGLSKASFGDAYPVRYVNSAWRYETIIPGSVRVQGLINNEYVRVRTRPTEPNTTWLTIVKAVDSFINLEGYDPTTRVRYATFTGNTDLVEVNKHELEGCDSSDRERTIILTFDTLLDDEWLSASVDDTSLQKHENKGTLRANTDPELKKPDILKDAKAIAEIAPLSIKKYETSNSNLSRTVNGVNLPIYKYEIVVSGVSSDELEITDKFDTSILEYYTGEYDDAGYVYGGGINNQLVKGGKFGLSHTADGIKITTDSESLPHDTSAESLTPYYTKYRFVYYLTVKNENALRVIQARAAAADGGVYKIENEASFNGKPASAFVTYTYEGLKKELLTPDSELKKTDEDVWPEFRITLNPGAEYLNGGNTLTLTDTVDNLSVDVTSIRAEPSEGVSWDMTGNTVTYKIPDATKVVITYRARVIMSTMPEVGSSQQITFSNRAEMKGYSDNVTATAERRNGGQGTASIASINLIKYEAGNMKKRLSGAKFQLQDANQKPIRGKDGKPVEFVSDANGMITIKGDMDKLGWAISKGHTYYLEELEAPAGYMLAGLKYQFTISTDGTTDYSRYIYHSGDNMTAKNYPGTDVRVQKTWTDGNQRHESDSVEVTLQQKMGDGEWSDVIRMEKDDEWTDEGRTLTLNKDNDWTGVFNKLPLTVPVDLNNVNGEDVAVTYRVVETEVNGNTPNEGAVTITRKAEGSGTYVYEITNAVDTGNLTVSKLLATGSEAYADQAFAFTVALSDSTVSGDYGDMTFTNGEATVSLKGGESATATGLPAGTTYSVTEEAATGFQNTSATGNTGTIEKDITSQATFVNARERGNLTVSKLLAEGSEAYTDRDFTFTIQLAPAISGTFDMGSEQVTFDEHGEATITLKGGESKTIEGLPTGTGYTVTEAETEGFSNTPLKSNDTGTITTTDSTVTFTNAHDTGSLTVTKTVESQKAGDSDLEFDFTVTLGDARINGTYGDMTFQNGVASFKLKDNQIATASGLPTGITYEVTETAADGFTTTQTGASGSISAEPATAAFTNTRTQGELEVTKVVESQKAGDKDLEFHFTVKLADTGISGTYGGMTFQDGVASFTLKDNQTVNATGLPTGIGYTVTESEENNGQFTTEKSGDTGTLSATKSAATFTNKRTVGELEVKKTVESKKAGDKDLEFHFRVTLSDTGINGDYGAMTFQNGVANFTLKNGETKKAEGLPTNITYTVTEAEAEGYVSSLPNREATGTIAVGKATTEFVNTRVEKGDLVVAKTVESALDADHTKQFKFTVTLSDNTISGTYGGMEFTNGVATFNLKDRETKSATGLPKGITYTVAEENDDAFDTQSENETGTIADDDSVTASFVNTRKTGKLKLSKEVISDAAADKEQSFTFTVTLDPAISGTFGTGDEQATFDAKGKTTVTLKHDETKTIAGLPRGVKYTVTETPIEGFDTSFEGETGTIAETDSEATFTNIRKTGSLEVSKELISDVVANQDREFEFTIQLSDTSINKTYSKVKFEGGKATIKLKGGKSKLIEGLPTGITYTVTEGAVDDFTLTDKTGDTGTIDTETAKATFKNVRDTGDLQISKTVVSDAVADSDQEFTFTITLGDTSINKTYSDVEFTDGVATIKLKDNETKTIKGLPVGITYTVAETADDGYRQTDQSGTTGNITKAGSIATFKNTRKTGELELSKTIISGLSADADQEFIFHVKLEGLTPAGMSKMYGGVQFTNGEASVNLKGGESKTIDGLPYGVTYTVTEDSVDGFELDSRTGDSGTISSVVSKTEFTNARESGELTVSKTLVSDAAADRDQEFLFTITLKGLTDEAKNDTYSGVKFTDGKATISLKGGESKTIDGLPVGAEYEVVEASVAGFQLTEKTGDVGTISAAVSEATFTNTRQRGDLEVSKTVVSDAASDKEVPFTFSVKLSDSTIGGNDGRVYGGMTFKNGVAEFTLKDGESAKAKGLPTGITYTVTEADAEGFQITSKVGDTGSITTTPAKATFTNTKDKGGLVVSKTLVSDAAADKDAEFEFTVTLDDSAISKTYGDMVFEDGVATFKLKGGESAIATDLPIDMGYTVTETAADGFTESSEGSTGTIAKGRAQTATFTNTRETGDLTVSKEIVSDAAADADAVFAFTVKLSDDTIAGTYGGMTFTSGEATFVLKGGESVTATGLPTGVDYAVTEADAAGFTTESEGDTGTIATKVSKATFTNTRETGDLTVSKALVSDVATDADQEFEFTVTLGDTTINGTYGAMTFANGVATFALKGGESVVATGLPTGVTYTVTEASVAGFEQRAKVGDTGSILSTGSTALVTNRRQTGDLQVSKELVSDAEADADQAFSFTVTLSDATINKTYSGVQFIDGVATVTLKGGESKTIEGLPVGVEYTVTEAEVEGFELTGKTGDEGTISATKSQASFTNTRRTGDLEVSKTLVSDAAADADREFTFIVTLSDITISKTFGDMAFANGVATLKLKGGESATATGLPTGITYTVTEAEANGGEFVTQVEGNEGTITTEGSKASFTNTRRTGDLEVSKSVPNADEQSAGATFEFTVELSDKTIGGTEGKAYGNMTFVGGVATFTLGNGDKAVATGLPTGIDYTVTEQPASDYITSPTNGVATGTLVEGTTSTAFVNNRVEKGDLVVQKSVESALEDDHTKEYDFTVTLSDTSINGAYGEMTFADGVATFKLKDGEAKVATGLPNGTGYTVTEAADEDFITTKTGEAGNVTDRGTATAAFKNTRKTGKLTVSKDLVSDVSADEERIFTFTIQLDPAISGTFVAGNEQVTFDAQGKAVITLKGGESKTISGLPNGVAYTVTEAEEADFDASAQAEAGIISASTSKATFTNTRKTGDLQVSKELVSDVAADADQGFNFNVKLSDANISKKYGQMTFTNGEANFTLKGGESATAEGLPVGVGYTVTEADAEGFELTSMAGNAGVISTKKSVATFTNTRQVGSLELVKELVSDDAADADEQFTFTLKLSDVGINNTYSGVKFKDGVATVTLKGGESKTIEGLPVGVGYTVSEAEVEGFELTGKTGHEGTISTTKSVATFTNTRETGDLKLSKELVTEAAADENQQFTFTVKLSDDGINGTYGEMTFVNGIATVTLKGGESVTAEGLPTGVNYTITESNADGFELTGKSGDEGTITTSMSEATFTNTRQTGDIELSKKVISDATADADQAFDFTVTLGDATIGGDDGKTYGDMTFVRGVARVTLKGGQTATATGLPTGVAYTIVETANGAFQTQKSGDVGVISQDVSKAAFTNIRTTGDLKLSKELVSDAAADAEQQFTFTVELSDKGINKTYSDVEFKDGKATVILRGGESKLIEGLPSGVGYSITEDEVDGFQITKQIGETGTISTALSEAQFTNMKDQGGLIVSKTLVSDASADANQAFEFTVTLSDTTIGGEEGKAYGQMLFKNGVATFKLRGGETKFATDLPVGIGYTVTEAAAEGFTLTSKTNDVGSIAEGEAKRAEFTNTRQTGDLQVSKELVSDTAADANEQFTFNVTLSDTSINKAYSGVEFNDGKATIVLKGGESKTIEGLPVGVDYTVTEAAAEGFEITGKSGNEGTISTTKSIATFTNTRQTGDLELSKVLVSEAAADANQRFDFTVTLSDDTIGGWFGKAYGDMTFRGGVATVSLKGGESATATGLPVGVGYTISEKDVEGFELTGNAGKTGVISTNATRATFTNTRQTGDLQVTKELVSDATADADQQFEFTVTLSDETIGGEEGKAYGQMTFKDGMATFKLKGGESATAIGLPTGISYTVTESDAEGFELSGKTGDTGTIDTTKAEATFTNARRTGDIELSKKVVSDAAADAEQQFTFIVELSDKGINKVYSGVEFKNGIATVSLRGGETKLIEGLPTGIGYTVTEAADDGFTTASEGRVGAISETVSKVTFTNTRKTGDLTVSKELLSDSAADADEEFTFTVTLSDDAIGGWLGKAYGDMTFRGGVATVHLKGGESATATGLPTGISYTVTEADTEGFEVTGKIGDEGTISTTKSVATFTNARETGDLQISKKVVSDAAADADKAFIFTITLSDTTINKTYSDVSFNGGKATVTLKGGESKLVEGLPTGVTYTVEEATNDAFTVQSEGATGSITTTPSKATFTNTRKTGDLKISKELISEVAVDANQEFTFTVTFAGLSSAAANKQYGNVQLSGGVATVTLKGGESQTIEGLPTGITYTVTEEEVEGFQNTGKVGDTGAISTMLSEATFTNAKDKGGLVIAKTLVSDAAADADQEFTFNIVLSDTSINATYSDVEFKDGVGNVTLRGGEAKQIEGLPNGITYTVTETSVDGFVLTQQSGSVGNIKKDVATRAEFTNTRETGKLVISKDVVSDTAADAEEVFTFTVTLTGLDETAQNKTYNGVEFVGGVATVTLRGGESKEIDGLPTGITYAVTEAQATGFELTGQTGSQGTISTTPSVATFTNTREVGDLTVSKTVVSDAAADTEQEFTFTVTLSDNTISGTYGGMTFDAGRATVTLRGGESATATGLPVGVTYEVTEFTNGDFTTESASTEGVISTTVSEATFTNTRKTGSLTVTKSVTSSTPADKKKGFLFEVTLSDATISGTYGGMGFRNGVATFALADGQTKTATGLPTGIDYTVRETTQQGFVTTFTGGTGQITTDGAVAAFTNTKDEGGLLVAKSVSSAIANDKAKSFNFTVTLDDASVNGTYGQMTFADGVATFDLADGQTMYATGLAQGIGYTVTEGTDEDFKIESRGETGVITEAVSEASFTNTRRTGDLTLSKAVVSDAAADASQAFEFAVTLSDNTISGTYGGMTFVDGVANVTLRGGESATATGLPVGIAYEVSEAASDGFDASATGASGTIAETPSEASFTNTRRVGDLTVSKRVVSDAAADAGQEFAFTVTLSDNTISGTYGGMTFDAGRATVTLRGGESATATGLPAGVTYTVTEAAADGFDASATGASGTIAETPSEASFTNTRRVGDLTVSKQVVSDAAADAGQEFAFTVTLSDNTISGTYGGMTFDAGRATVTLRGGESATATGLPVGIAYEVSEAASDGFVTTSDGQAGTIATTPSVASFTNVRDRGGLIVSKALVSDAAADRDREFEFTVTLSDRTIGGEDGKAYGEMTFVNGVATFGLRGGQTSVATDLPAGITYEVTEAASDDFVTTSTGATGTVSDAASLASFTNTRRTGGLTVSKAVVSDAAADKDQEFAFTVTLSDGTISGTYGQMTFDAGRATVTLRGGESATATGLPAGVAYTVTEAAADGFDTTSDGQEGTIATTPSVAAFTNTRKVGDLTVSKQVVSDAAADADAEFAFTVTLSDNTISGTYGGMTFDAGRATVTLRGGESATATGLPVGVTYEVSEAEESSEGFDVQATGDAGTIETAGSTATFINTRLLGSLKIQKQVTMDGIATITTGADGNYTFQITGPGAYEQGVNRTITITNGQSQTLTLSNLVVGDYTISEVTSELPANMHLLSQSPQTITVEANNEQNVPVAEFQNDLTSTQAALEVTKAFNNWDGAKNNTFSFRLTPVNDAPMPENTLIPNEDVRTVTSEERTATFGSITYTHEGTYEYKISEVVPQGADENGVFEGITYDTSEHSATVHVTADEDGALNAQVVYDESQNELTITNVYEATGSTELSGTKELTGRPLREGDTWTFTVTQPEGQNGPVPERQEVTVDAFTNSTIDFGTIGNFTFQDVGKTFTYQITESGVVEGVENDAEVKTVTIQVEDNGDGTLRVTNNAEEQPLTFTNSYQVQEDLIAYKGLLGRDWKTNDQGDVAEEFRFELYDGDEASEQKREQSNVSNTAVTHGAAHTAKFGTFTFTSEDVGKTYSYTVREVPATQEQADSGITIDAVMYDVVFRVVEEDGELKVNTSYQYGTDEDGNALTKDRLEFVNNYEASQTTATIEAQKILEGRNMADGEFEFELYSVAQDGSRFLQQTKSVSAANGGEAAVVVFDPIDFYEAGSTNYVITEVIPQNATQREDGTWTKNGITYDATEREVTVVVTDDLEGQLHAEVVYEGLQEGETLPTFTNTYFGAEADIQLNKEYYGTNDNAAFEFVLTAADQDFSPRDASASGVVTYDASNITRETPLVDYGQAFTVTQTNGGFNNNVATVSMPTITYYEPGAYRYVITEQADNDSVTYDNTQVLVTVTVGDDAQTTVKYQTRTDGEVQDVAEGERATLYNNEAVSLSFRSRALLEAEDEGKFTNYEPAVRKVLKNGTLSGGEFRFSLYSGSVAVGEPMDVATNDSNGAVSFNNIMYDSSDVGRTYTYTIVEEDTGDEAIKYDTDTITLTVGISEGADGELVVSDSYSKRTVDGSIVTTDPETFVNEYDTIVIHAVKRSREEPYDPLPGAHYGLWMVNPDGEDVYMGLGRDKLEKAGSKLESSANGDLYYDLPLQEGVAYYFLEESPPPAGHLVDPYPTDYFTLVHDDETGEFRLVYEADPDFAKYAPGVTR